jgi:ketosteroid isomerase-like protein
MVPSTALESVFHVESFINEYYDAWSGTDEDRIMSYYAENVVVQSPGTLMEGKKALRDQFVRPFYHCVSGQPPPCEGHHLRTKCGRRRMEF